MADRPRVHLGSVAYEATLKPTSRTKHRSARFRGGYVSEPKPLPWDKIEGKENCTLTVKVGKEHLTAEAREEITARRGLWGTDIYTDDSDIIAACIHGGWIRGEWGDDVDVDLLGLNDVYHVSDAHRAQAAARDKAANSAMLTEPPPGGPMEVPDNCDLDVTVLILPCLARYSSTTRYGICSRSWGGRLDDGDGESRQRAVHDGISFMITGLRWVTPGATSQDRLRGKAKRERIRKALLEQERIPWLDSALNASEAVRDAPLVEKKAGEISGTWWPQQTSKPASEGDKENAPVSAPTAAKAPASGRTATGNLTVQPATLAGEQDGAKEKEPAKQEEDAVAPKAALVDGSGDARQERDVNGDNAVKETASVVSEKESASAAGEDKSPAAAPAEITSVKEMPGQVADGEGEVENGEKDGPQAGKADVGDME